MAEKIVCSAIHYQDGESYVHQPVNIKSGIVICGLRHHNCITTLSNFEGFYKKNNVTTVQGFLTTENRFVDRLEAHEIHYGKSGELYSENLY